MTDEEDDSVLAAKIYIDCDSDLAELMSSLAAAIPTDRTGLTTLALIGQAVEIDCRRNVDFDPRLRARFPDGFLYFRFALDIVATQRTDERGAISVVSRLLEHLWGLRYPAVAASDYEDRLPRKGGYKDPGLPWPVADSADP